MAEITFVLLRAMRGRDGKPLPIGTALTPGDVAGWSTLPTQIEHRVVELHVDGEPLDRLVAAAALRTPSRGVPSDLAGSLPRAGKPHWLDVERPKPESKEEARSIAAGLAGPILDHGDDEKQTPALTKEERAKLLARFEPQLDHANDDHSLGTDDDHKNDADKKTRPGAKAQGDMRSEAKIQAQSTAAGLAGPILDHANDSGELDDRMKDAGLKPNAPTGTRYDPKAGKFVKPSKPDHDADEDEARGREPFGHRAAPLEDRDDPSTEPAKPRVGKKG